MIFCRCSGIILTWGAGNLSAFYSAINLPVKSLSIYTGCKSGMLPRMRSGGMSKLERYQALSVPEVWFWEDGLLKLYHLQNGSYEGIDRSQITEVSNFNLDLMKRCILMTETDTGEAIRAFRREM